jgi:hypothetical protein
MNDSAEELASNQTARMCNFCNVALDIDLIEHWRGCELRQ